MRCRSRSVRPSAWGPADRARALRDGDDHRSGFAFDLASARRERYARPGALPDVELGASIEEDLARRDFSVNAIAVSVADGALTAWPGAREDLDAGILRVLHDGSFVDDPTRMLRLVRYAARLDFAPAPETAELIAPALFDTVTGDRLGNEVRLMLASRGCASALRCLGTWHRACSEPSCRGLAHRTCAPGLLALAACCTAIPREALAARLDHLGFGRQDRDVAVAAAGGFERLHGALDGSDADLWRLLRRERVETVQLLAAAGDPGARRWLDHVRHRKLSISGDDLVAAGLTGAAVGEGLNRAMVAMLEGRAPDRSSQLSCALM